MGIVKKYYNGERIAGIDATYKILLGGRNLGKSYDTKSRVLKTCYDNGFEFTYLRRYDEDIKTANVERYFADLDISKLTGGAFTGVVCFKGCIFLCNYDDNGKAKDKKLIGYMHSLSAHQRLKSQMFPNVEYTIFEEFITEDDKPYLKDETDIIQKYVSTVYREKRGCVYMIGNTITKLCPYYSNWQLDKVNRMKAGDLDIYENSTLVLTEEGEKEIIVKIAVEMCTAKNVFSQMAFGSSASMIIKNQWATKNMPKVDEDLLLKCKDLYYIYVICDNLTFRLLLKQYKNNVFWYVVPFTKELTHAENTRIVSPVASPNRLHTQSFRGITPQEQKAFSILRENKIFYCNNETGTDFSQALKKIGF